MPRNNLWESKRRGLGGGQEDGGERFWRVDPRAPLSSSPRDLGFETFASLWDGFGSLGYRNTFLCFSLLLSVKLSTHPPGISC